jgi:hypothetical protein
MSEQKIEVNIDCLGTIDKKNKEGCNQCVNSGLCASFKPVLEKKTAVAEEKGRSEYIDARNVESGKAKTKYGIYGVIVSALLVLLWMIIQEGH